MKFAILNPFNARVALGLLLTASVASFASAQPVINSFYPSTLTESAGDHVAFTVSASGTGALTYQWYHNSTALNNQTNAWLVLTNIQTSDGGQYGVSVGDGSGNFANNSAILNVATGYLPISSNNLVVVRLGDGVQALSGATGNTIYLDQYSTNGAYVSTIQIPDNLPGATYGGTGTNKTITGNPAVVLPGAGTDAINEGVLTLSGDQQSLTFAGYQLAYPYTGADVTAGGSGNVRGIYTVNAYGYYSLAFTNYGLYSGAPHVIRSAWTSDGTNFWATGGAGSSGGLKYVNKNGSYPSGGGIPTITSSLHGPRVVQALHGNLIFSDPEASAGSGLYLAQGLKQLPNSTGATNISQLALNEGGIPNDFAISPDGNTVYIADGQVYGGSGVQAGGIERWDWNGNNYGFSYALPTVGTNGAQNLTVNFPPQISSWGPGIVGATVYATPSITNNNTLVSMVDSGAGSPSTVLIATGPNQALRGVRFGPPAANAVSIASQPSDQTAPVGNKVTFTVGAAGAPPFFYQWLFNGTNIPNATSPTLTLTNVQSSNAGNYSVIVSNPATSAVSASGALTVAAGAPVIKSGPQSRNETTGDHLAFSVAVSGSAPIGYQWYFKNAPVLGATNSALVLTNIQSANAGSYYVAITNLYGATNSPSATLGVTTGLQILSSNNLVVARVGDGSQALSGTTGNTIYLDQYTTAGTYVSSIQVPDQGAGLPYGYGAGTNTSSSANLPPGSAPLIVAGAGGDAPYEALLTLSADNAALNFAGYVEAYPDNTGDVTYPGPQTAGGYSTNNWRGIGSVSAYGSYVLSYTNAGLYSGGNHTIRSVASLEGVNFWSAGQAQNNGIKYFNILDASYAGGAGVPQVASSGPGPRVVQIINGNLTYSDASASPPGIYIATGGGTPELAKSGLAASTLLISEGGSPVDFVVSPDNQTVYIADDQAFAGSSVQGGGIQRWDSNGTGGYAYSYTLATGTNAVGAIGLTAYFPPATTAWGAGVTGAILYATTAEHPTNRLISAIDNGAGSSATTLSYSGANQTFAGIRFGPHQVPVALYNNPQATNVFASQSVTLSVTATGSAPYSYQWLFNGTNIGGATNANLIFNNVTASAAGAYSVVVSNNAGSTNSSAGQLTILAQPLFTPSVNLGNSQGFQLNFNGPATYGYSIWTSTNLALRPVKTTWTKLTTGSFSGGSDSFVDPNGGNDAVQFYLITTP